MRIHARRLPHWDAVGQPMFVTFRLNGSLPASRIFPPERMTSGRAFVAMDRLLDHARSGPLFLRQPALAQLVTSAIHDGEVRFHRYELHSYVVMPNHVHMLITAKVMAEQWLRPLKGFTGLEGNRLLGIRNTPFWQHESYDHLVRNDDEFQRIQRYIELNPVKAGLANAPEEFPWSSASTGGSPPASRKA